MLIFILIFIILRLKWCSAQECYYNVDRFEEINCSNLNSSEYIIENINTTLYKYNSLPELINSVELNNCTFSNLALSSFRFLSHLEKLKIELSNINTLSSEEAGAAYYGSTTNTNGLDGM